MTLNPYATARLEVPVADWRAALAAGPRPGAGHVRPAHGHPGGHAADARADRRPGRDAAQHRRDDGRAGGPGRPAAAAHQGAEEPGHRAAAGRGGRIGVTVATIWEAAAMAAAGVRSILVANEVIGARTRSARRGRAAPARRPGHRGRRPANIADLSAAMTAAGSQAGILVDLDVGMARCGARSPEQALGPGPAGARRAGTRTARRPGVRGTLHARARPRHPHPARDRGDGLRGLGQGPAAAPTACPPSVLSAGGTGTYNITGRNPAVTELQAGSYVFMDAFHGNLVPGFEVSLTVLTTVLARHGDTVIFDAGRKSIGIDFVSPPIQGYDYQARYYAEEHALFDTDPGFPRADRRPGPADLRLRADHGEPARRDLRRRRRPGRRHLAGVPARARPLRAS